MEFLESRAAERALVAERLLTFEKLASELLHEKKVTVEPEVGFRIETRDGQVLVEEQLSSGELHLLYLMVSALTTRRRGTVIAIDEPELSMHIAWQRRLVRTLFQCASKAEPQFILATHSPDIAAEYPESMIDLAG
ncbi:putative ATP-binding protein [Corallococcus macrosporus]|uniref:Putative ATP-binding protein n=1 Tax=Myxococcus fulvus (strain ATCC BAA-855 / HW-1) TaxID=483219 RepID=F8CG93_MYXFH|nr:putative ATP-binding protein [Corallococcus macrosporus]